jgi:hypothetical protein
MRVCLVVLLSLAVLALLLPLLDAASAAPRRPKAAAPARFPAAPRRGRVAPRRGRQDAAPAAPAPEGAEGSGDDIPKWCNPKDPMGAWLLFKGVKVNCVGKGFTDFGPYGSAPADEEETAEKSANAV